MTLVPDPSPPVPLPPGMALSAWAQKVVSSVPAQLRSASIPLAASTEMRGIWARNKRAWLARGWSLKPEGEVWVLVQWLRSTGGGLALTAVGEAKLAEFDAPRELDLDGPSGNRPVSATVKYRVPVAIAQMSASLSDKLRPYQKTPSNQIYRALSLGRSEWGYPGAADLSDMGCHAKGQLILMADGSRRKVEDIVVGDIVEGWKGPQKVTELKRGRDRMVQICPTNGKCWTVNWGHIMTFADTEHKRICDFPIRSYVTEPSLKVRRCLKLMRRIDPFRIDSKMELLDFTTFELPEAEYFGFSLDGDGRFLLGDGTITHNTGKTYMDLAAALATGLRVVVLCPTVGEGGWRRAFTHFGTEPNYIGTYEALRGNYRSHIAELDTVNDRFVWKNADKIILILDESQICRHDTSLTVKLCKGAIRQGIPIITASATIATSPLEFRFAGRITGLHQGEHDWHRFLAAHGCQQTGQTWKWDGKLHHLVAINRRLFPDRGARVRKEDMGDECPETSIDLLPFDVPEGREIARDFEEAQEMIQSLWAQRMSPKIIAIKEQAIRMKVWHKCEMALVPYVAKHARERLIAGRSVAIFCNFNDSRMALGRLLGFKGGFFGGQNPKVRAHWEKQFQEDREFCLISNIGAGGASVSLHDVRGWRPRTAYIFPTDQVVKMVQATGRVDRLGSKSVSEQFIPFITMPLIQRMVESTRRKMLRIDTLNDGENAISKINS